MAVQEAQQIHTKGSQLLKWLCDLDPSTEYNAARDKHKSGTSDWLVEESEQPVVQCVGNLPGSSFLWFPRRVYVLPTLTCSVVGIFTYFYCTYFHTVPIGLVAQYVFVAFSSPNQPLTLDFRWPRVTFRW